MTSEYFYTITCLCILEVINSIGIVACVVSQIRDCNSLFYLKHFFSSLHDEVHSISLSMSLVFGNTFALPLVVEIGFYSCIHSSCIRMCMQGYLQYMNCLSKHKELLFFPIIWDETKFNRYLHIYWS